MPQLQRITIDVNTTGELALFAKGTSHFRSKCVQFFGYDALQLERIVASFSNVQGASDVQYP